MQNNLGFYDKKYFQDRANGPAIMAETVALFLTEKKCKTILDVGCGSGWLIRYLQSRGFKAKGCDIAPEAIKVSGQVRGSATKLPFKTGAYDAILGISIIEHMLPQDVEQFLREAFRVLKPGGWLFLDTPNYHTPWRFLFGKNWAGFGDPTHINFYSPTSLKKILTRHKFYNTKLTFSYFWNLIGDFGFPKLFKYLPKLLQRSITYLVLSTPLYYLRHSFWIGSQKKVS